MLSVRETIERIDELLETAYNSADLGNIDDVLSETVYVLLSQQTRERVYQRVFATLRRAYPTWLGVMRAPPTRIEALLRPAGFHIRRTKQLKSLLAAVAEANRTRRTGPYGAPPRDLTLEFLHELSDREAEAFLDRLPGVGPKTARCVLTYSMARPSFPVDTHVHRIMTRLELAPSRGRKLDHDPYQSLIPPKVRKRLHINLVHHGRSVCRSKRERCGDCILVSFCGRGQRNRATLADKRPVGIDLFAGAGGLGRGFASTGYRIALAVEADRHAAQTYRLNHPGVPVIERRIGAGTTSRLLRQFVRLPERVDVVIAGPPCQGYSVAGIRRPADPRNTLYRHVVRLAREFSARHIVIENVPGIRNVGGIEFAARLEIALKRGGFIPTRWMLQARDFGVPQLRARLFFVAHRRRVAMSAPSPTHSRDGATLPKTPSVLAQLRGLPRLPAGVVAERLSRNGRTFFNVSTMAHSSRVVRKIAKIGPGGGPISYRRLRRDVAFTIIAGHRALPIHPSLNRAISVREAARIQGFPDDYRFCGPRGTQPLQVANAVPPALGSAIAAALKSQIRVKPK